MKSDKSGECGQAADADNLCVEMNDLMHDYEVMSRISDLVVQLKGKYEVREQIDKFILTYNENLEDIVTSVSLSLFLSHLKEK